MTTPIDQLPPDDDTDKTEVEPRPRGAPPDEIELVEAEPVALEVGVVTEKNYEKKDRNEDAVLVDERSDTYGVLDGVGGHAGGEVASSRSSEFIREDMQRMSELARRDAGGAAEHIRKTLVQTSLKLTLMADVDPKLHGMGSTCSLIHLVESPDGGVPQQAVVTQVGDSRIYRLRRGRLERLTTDQSMVQEIIDRGLLPPDADQVGDPEVDARLTPGQRSNVLRFGNVIHMALGPIMVQGIGRQHGLFEGVDFEKRGEVEQRLTEIVERIRGEPEFARWMAEAMEQAVVTRVVDVEPGDEFIAVSDGAHDNLLDREMEDVARRCSGDPTCTSREIVRAARERERAKTAAKQAGQPIEGILSRGKDDDISAVAIRIVEQSLVPRTAIEKWRGKHDDALESLIGEYQQILQDRMRSGGRGSPGEISRARGLRDAYERAQTDTARAAVLAKDTAYKQAALDAINDVLIERQVPQETLAQLETMPTSDLEGTAVEYRTILEAYDRGVRDPQLIARAISRAHGMREAYGQAKTDSQREEIVRRDWRYKRAALIAISRIIAARGSRTGGRKTARPPRPSASQPNA
ncbi:protein serine/threonine phosphatase 2C family protein [Candidatus Uhrbacteria bacterium]|nr:protein serine/threonine phosphatase 2C family protein [Candidatus Uhrbacteria bacterium]